MRSMYTVTRYVVWVMLLLLLAACGDDKPEDKPTLTPSDTPTLTPSATLSITEVVASPTSAVVQIRVTAEEAPIFEAPNTSASVIISLFAGDVREVLGKSAPDVVGITYFQIDL